MRILFISSGKSGGVGAVVKNQGESLIKAGIELDYYIIKPGLWGYLSSIPGIRRTFKQGNYDLAHAHYSFSGFIASLSGCHPLVVSLMGSDAFVSSLLKKITRVFSRHIWDKTIVKTSEIREYLDIPQALIIPNGVDIKRFKPVPREEARSYLNISEEKYLIIFIAINNRPEKNLGLAIKAVRLLDDKNIIFKHIHDIDNSEIPYFLNASDVLLLTSRWEGSVNVIKEAMATNCPVVSTDVGDVSWVFGQTDGCYLSSFEAENIAANLRKALEIGRRTNGRQRIVDLGLDSESVARRLLDAYRGLVSGIA